MKVLILEATAEELKANRTLLNSIVDAVCDFTQSLAGVELDEEEAEKICKRLAEKSEEE